MACVSLPILPLSTEVAAQIKSSTAITSLTSVVLDLLRNSLDARACKVEIAVDFLRGGCSVEDDGLGIPPAEFEDAGGLGKMYHTSKHNDLTVTHGRTGTFLASLAALALVTITSRHQLHRSHNTIIFHHSKPVARLIPAPSHQQLIGSHGTRILVRDLFGNMPVRVKQRGIALASLSESEREWDSLKMGIVGLLLAWGKPVNVTVRDASRKKKIAIHRTAPRSISASMTASSKNDDLTAAFLLKSVRSIFFQAGYVLPERWESWIFSSARSSSIDIRGAISLDPAPTKRRQFISLGVCPVSLEDGNNVLYEEINRIFTASDFGTLNERTELDSTKEKRSPEAHQDQSRHSTQTRMRSGRNRVDKWPMFYLHIELKHDVARSQCYKILESTNVLGAILEVLRAMIVTFLKEHHFRPRRVKDPSSYTADIHGYDTFARGSFNSLKRNTTTSEHNISSANNDSHRPSLTVSGLSHSVSRTAASPVQRGSGMAFDGWRRVKSGKQGPLEGVYNSRITSPQLKVKACPYLASASLPPYTPEAIGKPCITSTSSDELSAIVVSPDHKDKSHSVAVDHPERHACTPKSPEAESLPLTDETPLVDDIIPWTNPISKTTILINVRTGLEVIPSLRRKTSSSHISEPSTPARLSTLQNKRLRLTSKKQASDSNKTAGGWLDGVLKDWTNPVFRPAEEPVRCVSFEGATTPTKFGSGQYCSHTGISTSLESATASISGKLSKAGLMSARIVAQVDKKFILARIDATVDGKGRNLGQTSSNEILVLIDQHAADERCRVEALYQELCTPPSTEDVKHRGATGVNRAPKVRTTYLTKPIKIQATAAEYNLYRCCAEHLADWGILLDLGSSSRGQQMLPADNQEETLIFVEALPLGIAERCKSEPRLLIELLRAEIWKRDEVGVSLRGARPDSSKEQTSDNGTTHKWLNRLHECPAGILDMLNSRACRSAIMFNDTLSIDECRLLVSSLARCAFPFQCAHGRPSMVPLVSLEGLDLGNVEQYEKTLSFPQEDREQFFMEKCLKWKRSLREGDCNVSN